MITWVDHDTVSGPPASASASARPSMSSGAGSPSSRSAVGATSMFPVGDVTRTPRLKLGPRASSVLCISDAPMLPCCPKPTPP